MCVLLLILKLNLLIKQINKSMAQRIKIKQCYDKTIEEAEHNYTQLELSSGLLLDSVKKAANKLDETMDKKVGTDSDTIKPEDVLPEKDGWSSNEKNKQTSNEVATKRASEVAAEKAKRASNVAEKDEEVSKESDKRKVSEQDKLISTIIDDLDEVEDESPDIGIEDDNDRYNKNVRTARSDSDSISSSEDEEERYIKNQSTHVAGPK